MSTQSNERDRTADVGSDQATGQGDPTEDLGPDQATGEGDRTAELDPEQATVSLSRTGDGPAMTAEIPPPGTLLGKYRVEGLLGEGGMGVVVAATHARLGRKVALKLMRPGVRADRQALRLVREARATGRLESPYVAKLVDVEELPDGTPYLVLERLDGETLSARLRREGPLPLAVAATALAQAALGLATAHAAGIVHRDVKPSNLFFVAGEGGQCLVKVLDFGIAKSTDPHDVTLTTDAAMLGSPAYMSPEQTRAARDVDARSDVWSLGVTLFEALSGELPFPGASAQAVAARVAADPPRSLAALRPELPRAVIRLVEQCLEKDPARRCPSALAFARALAPHAGPLGAALAEEARALAVTADMPSSRGRASRTGIGVSGAIVAAIAITIAITIGVRAARRAPSAPAAASAASARAPAASRRAFAPVSPRRVTYDESCEEFPTWTPDGRSIVFDAASGKDTHVFSLDLATGTRRRITSGAGWQMAAAVSPRGDAIAYLNVAPGDEATYLAALDGSSPRRISPAAMVRPSFSPDGAFVWTGHAWKPERVDVRTGETSRSLVPPDGVWIYNLLELADGRVIGRPIERDGAAGLVLFGAGQSRGAWLWRVALDEVIELAPDGDAVLASKGTESEVPELWRVPLDGAPPAHVPASAMQPTKGLRISPDGTRVAWSTCRAVDHLARTEPGAAPGTLVVTPRARANDWLDQYPIAVPGTPSSVLLLSSRTGRLRPCVVDLEEREPARCLDIGDLAAGELSPSADGKHYVFVVVGKGLFVAPLDGSSRPKAIVPLPEGDSFSHPAIAPDGRELYFSHSVAGGKPYIDVVPIDGGPARRFLDRPATGISFSPKGDHAAFLLVTGARATMPMVMNLATKEERRLSAELAEDNYGTVRWNAGGTRAAVVRATQQVLEIDVTSGKVLRRLDAGNDQVSALTYVGDELVLGRETWIGDIWVADLR